MDLKSLIRTIPDFPHTGIQFKDIESITEHPAAFAWVIKQFADECENHAIDKIVALDARGFLFGAALGLQLALPVVMARKKGKLGGDCVSQTYALEYGEAEVELQKTAVKPGDQVLIIDDLLATGGTAAAAAALVNKVGGKVKLFAFVIELAELKGRDRLGAVDAMSLVFF